MKITFLGTAAAQGYPVGWCECPYCKYAREHGGRNVRNSSCAMLDDDVLLDLNEPGMHMASRLGISMAPVKTMLITHVHSDHVTPAVLDWRWGKKEWENAIPEQAEAWFRARFTPVPTLNVYGSEISINFMNEKLSKEYIEARELHLTMNTVVEGQTYEDNGMSFIPVVSHHDARGFCHNYIITRNGKTLLYATDTGGYDDDMYDLLAAHHYDAVVTECTFGNSTFPYDGHFTLEGVRAFRSFLIEKGCMTAETPFLLTHISPHWVPPYDFFAPEMAREGITVAYDGMALEI